MQSAQRQDRRQAERAWLALRMVRGVGPVVYQGLLRAFGTPQAVFDATVHALDCAGVRPEVSRAIRQFGDWGAVDRQMDRLQRHAATLVTWNDVHYPPLLRRIHDPPPFLIMKGSLEPRDAVAVAVVGSRQVSAYGLRLTRQLTDALCRHQVTIVSGLARGTDAAAHWAAIRAGGRTIAVLGSGIDVIYPSEHHALFQAITRQGAVVTELFMGTTPEAENFPNRNRIVSGLALGTVVIEATERSGSLITAGLAAEQGREVFAVPGAVGAGTRGTHRLIRQGAKLTECADDILEEIAPQIVAVPVATPVTPLAASEASVMNVMRDTTLHIDEIIARSGLAPAAALQALLELELKGIIEQLPGKFFVARAVDAWRLPTQE